jgi:hypothetical protein
MCEVRRLSYVIRRASPLTGELHIQATVSGRFVGLYDVWGDFVYRRCICVDIMHQGFGQGDAKWWLGFSR